MIKGSSVVATFYSLHGILDTVQIFALLLSTIGNDVHPPFVTLFDSQVSFSTTFKYECNIQ